MSEGIDRALIQQEESNFNDRTNWAYCDVCDEYMEDCTCDEILEDDNEEVNEECQN